MNDPRVVALNYKIEHHSSVDYDKASPLDHSEGDFEIHVEGNDVRFAMNRHYATQSEAIEAIESYIRSWECLAALQNGPNEFKLVFVWAEIEDRAPMPGVVNVSVKPVRFNFSVGEPSIHVSRGAYPRPPSSKMEFSPEIKLMFDRYVGYRAHREPLTGMANFCLTVLVDTVQSGKDHLKAAASHFDIDYKVLNKVGHLCACKGGAEARKALGIDQDLNGQERQFLEEVVKAIIQRAAEVAGDPNGPRDKIVLSDFLDLPPQPRRNPKR